MAETSYKFKIGTFECITISDGDIAVGKPQQARETMDVCCLFIRSGRNKILIDTGCGNSFQASSGKLIENMKKEGIEPSAIDTIVYTHGHLDHVGGTFDSAGKLLYPNARQFVAKKEWDSWANMTEAAPTYRMFSFAKKNLLPIQNRFTLLPDNGEVMPGIKLVPAVGHTLGGVMVQISSGKDTLLCIGDLIHSFKEFADPKFYSFLDAAPDEAVRLRTEGLAKIAKSGDLVFACHFPFPGIGRIVQKGVTLSWQPVRRLI
jgi:glyoxylase-like metal-dependent hydrolase (beta-lactamase superfamily II)